MKNCLLILITTLLFNCTSKDVRPVIEDEELLGKWELIEQLVDPGDGSGIFNPIVSERVIEFFGNGTVTVNGLLCYMSSEVDDQNSGTFSEIDSEHYDGELIPTCLPISALDCLAFLCKHFKIFRLRLSIFI